MNLKIAIAGLALALLAAGTARAADAVIEEPPPAVDIPVFTWTGFYVGIQGGYVWTDFDGDVGDFDNLDGGLFGGYVGYNFQYLNWVFGVEGDFNGSGTTRTSLSLAYPAWRLSPSIPAPTGLPRSGRAPALLGIARSSTRPAVSPGPTGTPM